jgi:TolB-like protein
MAGEDGGRTAVAVLPFENMSASEENAYFADGIHEDILTHLSRLEDLTVLSRASVLRYRDTEKRPGDIAAELGAHAVLEGSVRRVGKDVRIVVQLIDPNTEGQLWADTYDRTLHDVFQVQTEVARQVARSLEATLSPQEAERISKRPTESLAAYDLYLQVRAALERSDPEQNESAIWLFREALEDDAQFALARAGLSRAFVQRIRFGQPRIWVDSAVAAAHRAIEMDPEAAGYARDSLNLAPDNELFFWHYTETLLGLSLLLSGDTEECRRVLRTAMEEDRRRLQEGAVRAVPWDLAAAHAALGQEDAAVDRLEQAYENGFRHPQWLKIDPAFDGIRDDVRFRRIMERLEADLAEMRERVQEQFPHRG